MAVSWRPQTNEPLALTLVLVAVNGSPVFSKANGYPNPGRASHSLQV